MYMEYTDGIITIVRNKEKNINNLKAEFTEPTALKNTLEVINTQIEELKENFKVGSGEYNFITESLDDTKKNLADILEQITLCINQLKALEVDETSFYKNDYVLGGSDGF